MKQFCLVCVFNQVSAIKLFKKWLFPSQTFSSKEKKMVGYNLAQIFFYQNMVSEIEVSVLSYCSIFWQPFDRHMEGEKTISYILFGFQHWVQWNIPLNTLINIICCYSSLWLQHSLQYYLCVFMAEISFLEVLFP